MNNDTYNIINNYLSPNWDSIYNDLSTIKTKYDYNGNIISFCIFHSNRECGNSQFICDNSFLYRSMFANIICGFEYVNKNENLDVIELPQKYYYTSGKNYYCKYK